MHILTTPTKTENFIALIKRGILTLSNNINEMKQKYFSILVIVGTIGLLAAGCNNKTSDEQATPQTNTTNQTTLSTTYTNSKYGYQVSHAADWSPKETEEASIVRFLPSGDSATSNVKFWITVDDNPNSLAPKDYLKTVKELKEGDDFTGQMYKAGNQTGFRTTIGAVEHIYFTKGKYIYSLTRFTTKLDTATFDKVAASFQIK
jgi:hypothetical protein